MNYTQYNPSIITEDLSEDEQDQLDELLQVLPADGAMDLECLDGYLTALLIAPELPAVDDWLPPVWGLEPGEPAPFASGKQLKRCVQWILRHMGTIDRQLKRNADALEPLFGIAEIPGEDEGEVLIVVDAEIWCIGFLQAMDLQPAHWDAWLNEPAVAELLAPIVRLGSDPDSLTEAERTELADPAVRDALSRKVAEAIAPLYQRARPQAPATPAA